MEVERANQILPAGDTENTLDGIHQSHRWAKQKLWNPTRIVPYVLDYTRIFPNSIRDSTA